MLKFLLFILCGILCAFTHVAAATSIDSVTELTDNEAIIYRHLATVLNKRSSKGIQNTPQLHTTIVAQIKARIHTEISRKISATIFQKVKANLSITASVKGGQVQVNHAEIEAIQSAAVHGLQSKISKTIEKRFDKVISDTVAPKLEQWMPSNQKVLTTTQLSKTLMNAETLVRSQLKTTLPDVQKTLQSSINTQLKAQIKDLEIDIPGILKIKINAKINVVSSVKTVVTSIYKSYADVSVAVVVKSYVGGIQKSLSKS